MTEFKAYWKALDPVQKKALATRCGCDVSMLSQIAHGHKKAGIRTIIKLNKADMNLTPAMLRPDLYGGGADLGA